MPVPDRARTDDARAWWIGLLRLAMAALLVAAALPAGADTFTVSSLVPDGEGGVLQAFAAANFNPGPDTIIFAIGSQTIPMTSQLFVGEPTTIRAEGGTPVLDGSNAASTTRGLLLTGSSVRVTGLAIRNFPNVAIEVRGSDVTIESCILSGSQFGVLVSGVAAARNVQIGGLPDKGNFIYGNTFGISTEPGAEQIGITYNVVGIDEQGVVSPNTVGIALGGDSNAIASNVVSGNTLYGISVAGAGAIVSDNNIGLTRDEMSAAPNGTGILVTGDEAFIAPFVLDRDRPNVISGNTGDGIVLGASRAIVLGNRIGVHRTLPLAFPNGGDGIRIEGPSNQIGVEAGQGNTIGANGGVGIRIQGPLATQNSLRSNVIGGAFPNGESGIRIEAPANRVGTDPMEPPGANTIGANGLDGIEIVGPDAFGNLIDGNLVENNPASGIHIVDASDNLVGSTIPNEIRGNALNGVDVDAQSEIADRNTIRRNRITQNDGFGIALFGTAQASIDAPTTELVDKGSNGVTGTALPDATVDLYSDPDDEGAFYIGSATADGTGSYSSAGSLALWAGSFVNATQTDVDGNTSEFSVPLPIPTGRVSVLPMVGDTLCLNHLDADQVVPPGASDAIGTATFAVETVGEAVLLRIDHTVQSPTAAEIRLGAPGENGPVVLDLGAPESPVIAVLQGIDFRTFTAGDHYLLISSADAPAGEIRGPVLCPEPAPAVQALAALLGLLGLRVRCSFSCRASGRARRAGFSARLSRFSARLSRRLRLCSALSAGGGGVA